MPLPSFPKILGHALWWAFRAATVALLLAGAFKAQAQSPELSEQINLLRNAPVANSRLVLASANMKVGVSLERLTLLSGEGHMDQKLVSGLMAGAATLMLRGAGGADFAQREPIEDHLNSEDAAKITEEALAILLARLKEAGVDVTGPQAVAQAPFYAAVKGEAGLTTDTASQKGGMFKKGYHYGFYRVPVAGLKFREPGLFTLAFADEELFPKARAAVDAGGAIDLSVAFYNDKNVFGLFDMTMRVWGAVPGRGGDAPILAQEVKNKDAFTVPSGGKDTYAYWTAFKPKYEAIATAMAERVAKALPPQK